VVEARTVTVTVTDTGEGIAPEHLPHLGERFYPVDAARSPGGYLRGTGLGLTTCRSIIEAHAGRMTIESKLGEGTAVRIRLPPCPPPAWPSCKQAVALGDGWACDLRQDHDGLPPEVIGALPVLAFRVDPAPDSPLGCGPESAEASPGCRVGWQDVRHNQKEELRPCRELR
jgi:hypothetical protein